MEESLELCLHRQSEIRKEHLWYSLTMFTVNSGIIVLNVGLISSWILMGASGILSLYALRIVLQRAVAYFNTNIDYRNSELYKSLLADGKGDLFEGRKEPQIDFRIIKSIDMIISEKSGALFYFMLILFSFIGVLLAKLNLIYHFL